MLRATGGEPMNLTVSEREEAVRRLHAVGLSDGAIAERLHMAGRTALRVRHRLGLEANFDDAGNPVRRTG